MRDLGGLPVAGGGRIRGGALVRADSLAALTPAGLAALRAYGSAGWSTCEATPRWPPRRGRWLDRLRARLVEPTAAPPR